MAHFLQTNQAVTIEPKWQYVPFLSLKDNLSLANKRKTFGRAVNCRSFRTDFLKRSLDELTSLEEVKSTIVTGTFIGKTGHSFRDSFKNLHTADIQALLPLCSQLAKQFQLSIYLMNEDERLAHTPISQNNETFLFYRYTKGNHR